MTQEAGKTTAMPEVLYGTTDASLDPRSALRDRLQALDPGQLEYATEFIDHVLQYGSRAGVSDVHVQPTLDGLELRWRLDGVLHPIGVFPRGEQADPVARLKVLAELLTYRQDIPQEGRIRQSGPSLEIRVSTFPVLHGERVAIRWLHRDMRTRSLAELGLAPDDQQALAECLQETQGAVVVTGPAGSGKTTTAYACLRHIADATRGGRNLMTLEDPVEAVLDGVSQSKVRDGAAFDFPNALRSLLRQDPEVILVGEIRDGVTATIAYQAALTGQLLLTTFHAGSATAALTRLLDMGIEPYVLAGGTNSILGQRLVRKLCDCGVESTRPEDRLGLPVPFCRISRGCDGCQQSGYRGRFLLAELLPVNRPALRDAILRRAGPEEMEETAMANGMISRWQRGIEAVTAGITSPAEIRRVLGFRDVAKIAPSGKDARGA